MTLSLQTQKKKKKKEFARVEASALRALAIPEHD
jgi:hypothetical protein